jgi:uncharacterized protein DUF5076
MRNSDPRQLALPEHLESDRNAVELLAAWSSGGKVVAITATATGLEKSPAFLGKILASIAASILLSAKATTGADPGEALSAIGVGLDRTWGLTGGGRHYPG